MLEDQSSKNIGDRLAADSFESFPSYATVKKLVQGVSMRFGESSRWRLSG